MWKREGEEERKEEKWEKVQWLVGVNDKKKKRDGGFQLYFPLKVQRKMRKFVM